MPKFTFNKKKFDTILEGYAEIREQTIPQAVCAGARLLCVELARRTQPFGDSKDAQKTGEKAIVRDLRGRGGAGRTRAGLFSAGDFDKDQGFAWYATGPNVRLFISKDGYAYGTDKSYFKPGASKGEMRSFHKSKFVNGRMSSAGSRDRTIGRWKFIEKWFVDGSTLDSYIDDQIKKVGWAKAGWAACARDLPKITKGSSTRGIPSWVTRHDSIHGDVVDNSNDLSNPRVKLINSTPYAHQVCPPNEVANATAVIVQKMINQMSNILKKQQKIVTI